MKYRHKWKNKSVIFGSTCQVWLQTVDKMDLGSEYVAESRRVCGFFALASFWAMSFLVQIWSVWRKGCGFNWDMMVNRDVAVWHSEDVCSFRHGKLCWNAWKQRLCWFFFIFMEVVQIRRTPSWLRIDEDSQNLQETAPPNDLFCLDVCSSFSPRRPRWWSNKPSASDKLITKRRNNMQLTDPTEMNHEEKLRPSVRKSGL